MAMRVTLHAFRSDPSLPQRDGVNIAHSQIAAMMHAREHKDVRVGFHDFMRLCSDGRYARDVLSDTDCVVSNVGPHAHYYFYLREKFGLDFRIVRDIRTALWSSYLIQEALCRPYLRPQDALMALSVYSKELTRRVFPHLRGSLIFVFEPLMFPWDHPKNPTGAEKQSSRKRMLGYVGRLSEDKNFPQLIDLILLLHREQPGRFRLLACGDIHSPSCEPRDLQARLYRRTGRTDLLEYLSPREYEDLGDIYRRFDVFLFPSTSNLETFGRVLAEASHCGLPILASDHAAAPQLLAPEALSPVEYNLGESYATHFDHALGVVNIEDMAVRLLRDELVPARAHSVYPHDPGYFADVLLGRVTQRDVNEALPPLTTAQMRFLDLIELRGMADYPDKREADEVIGTLLDWFCVLQDKASPHYADRMRALLGLSRYKERTQRYMEKSRRTRGDFTNLGGVDIELCHLAQFWPEFALKPPAEDRRKDTRHPGKPSLETPGNPGRV